MAKENRRVKMTKSLLCSSFLTLLQGKPLSRITVKEICEGADVNRSTYYAYYTDPYDQLNQMVQTFLQEQTVYMDTILNGAESGDSCVVGESESSNTAQPAAAASTPSG